MGFFRSFRRQMKRYKSTPRRRHKALIEPFEPRILLSADLSPVHPDSFAHLNETDETALGLSFDTFAEVEGQDFIVYSGFQEDVQQPAQQRREIVFVDQQVEDYEILLESIRDSDAVDVSATAIEVIVLDRDRDGLEHISEILAGRSDIDAVHILSHGSEGSVQLGGSHLSSDNLDQYQDRLSGWAEHLSPDADILLYGCNIAGGKWGVAFMENLSALTGADIAASVDLTGATVLGGDWFLERTTGVVETSVLFQAGEADTYAYLLDDIIGTDKKDRLESTQNNDTLTGKQKDDTYVFKNSFGKDKVIERANEGTDTLDLSRVPTKLNIKLAANGQLKEITSGVNSIKGPGNGNLVHVEVVKGGTNENTLDLSSYDSDGLTVLVKKAGGINEVIVKKGTTILLTVNNVTNIIGSQNSETYLFEKGGTLKGFLDGRGGVNTLSYEGYKSPVAVRLDAEVVPQPNGQNGFKQATGISKGVKNISEIKGTKKGDPGLVGDDQDNAISGGKGNDVLRGNAGADVLKGEDGKDTLTGGLGDDELLGGAKDDTYIFEDNWGRDKVVEEADKGTDTLDFKAVTHDLTFDIKPNGTGDGKGIQVSPTIDGNAVVGTGFAPRIQHVEVLVGGTGTNKYNFGKDWAKSLLIDNQASSSGTLDFSRVGPGVDLTFVVENTDPGFLSKFTGVGFPVALNKITVTDGNKHKAIAYNIHNLIGGQGNNTYEFKDGAVLPGKLTGGPARRPTSPTSWITQPMVRVGPRASSASAVSRSSSTRTVSLTRSPPRLCRKPSPMVSPLSRRP